MVKWNWRKPIQTYTTCKLRLTYLLRRHCSFRFLCAVIYNTKLMTPLKHLAQLNIETEILVNPTWDHKRSVVSQWLLAWNTKIFKSSGVSLLVLPLLYTSSRSKGRLNAAAYHNQETGRRSPSAGIQLAKLKMSLLEGDFIKKGYTERPVFFKLLLKAITAVKVSLYIYNLSRLLHARLNERWDKNADIVL